MIRTLAAATLLAGTVALVALTTTETTAAPATAAQHIRQEPVLVYDVTGGTLSGPVHAHLTVYNSGLVTYSEAAGLGTPVVNARTAYVAPDLVHALAKSLSAAGAFALPDQPLAVADIPLKTLTVFRGDTDAFAHTYSYWMGLDSYAAADQAVRDFINTHLPPS